MQAGIQEISMRFPKLWESQAKVKYVSMKCNQYS